MRSAILLVLAVAYPQVASAGPCAIQSPQRAPLVSAPVSPGGGVIVALRRAGFRAQGATSAVDKAWRFKDVNALVEPAAVQDIAPGLAVYTLPPTGGPELSLVDGDGNDVAKVVRAGKAASTLAAPPLKSMVYETRSYAAPRRGLETYTIGIADVGMQVPDTAAALIVYEVTKSGNVARSWASIIDAPPEPKSTKISAYHSGGRCNPNLPGITPIAAGSKVVVAWLDTSGRLSPVSKPVTAKAVTRR